MSELALTIEEPTALTLEYAEALIKPEQEKSVTPSYSAQTVLPDAGMTLGRVNVSAIPDPTDVKSITSNGDHDVRRYGTARVAVPQGVFPAGTLDIAENGNFDVAQYENVSVNIVPQRNPVLIDSVDIAEFAEPVNRVNIDMSQYSLDGFDIIYLDLIEITSSRPDWLYLTCGSIEGNYFGSAISQLWEFDKVFFVKIHPNEVWRNVINRTNLYPNTGDNVGLGNISFYFYYTDTTFTKGRINIYAI